MPELPEVETVMRGMAPVVTNQMIKKATPYRAGLRYPFPENFSDQLQGKKVISLYRRSKYILMAVEGNITVLIHLGMSGRVKLIPPEQADAYQREKHDHIVLTFASGFMLVYHDPRRFGMWLFLDSDQVDQHDLIKSIGPEPLGNDLYADDLWEKFQRKKSPIKTVLLDQKIIAGLGNIYVCEVLWRVGLHPETLANRLSKSDVEKLIPAIRTVLQQAIDAGGSTLKDHAQVDGTLGYFQHQFNVYGRESDPCYKEGCFGVVKRMTQSGRSTFYCDSCQNKR